MRISTQAFHVPKQGNAEAEYEDAYSPVAAQERDLHEYRCAVADGATESAFSGPWAHLLVRNFTRRRLRLKKLQRCWSRYVQRQPSLPWYIQAKLGKGAHAALCGLRIRDVPGRKPPGGTWRVLAVGDSCVFHVREEEMKIVGPVTKSADFDNSPYLLSTNGNCAIGRHLRHVRIVQGRWRAGDVFYLATDALAQWILAQVEAGNPPWQMLGAIGSKTCKPYAEIVETLRKEAGMKNDDTTLMRVEVA
jgi:hypothetical protein